MKDSRVTESFICGIQQIGIGNNDVYATWKWYRQNLGMDVPVFDEAAEAALMLPYTGGQPRKRHAILALNMRGGGGAEIWQYTERKAEAPKFDISLGDLGIYMAKFKSSDIQASHTFLSEKNEVSDIYDSPSGAKHFYLSDPFGNYIEVTESKTWFSKKGSHSGGVYGAVIGVSDMEASMKFYRDVLGYDQVIFDKSSSFDDFKYLGTAQQFRRVLLTHSKKRKGPFSGLFGDSQIELVQSLDRTPKKIFEGRLWGDLGYIHLCFDIVGMDALRGKCIAHLCPFTVDSGDFDMGEAAGQFAYIEDPDGTLIEFVETHKAPIMKKLNWFLDLRKRNREKPLPRYMLKAMGLGRHKDKE